MSATYDWRRFGSIPEAVAATVGDYYGLYGRLLPLDTDLSRHLGSDDFDRLEVIMAVEELFDVRFGVSDRAAIRTLRDLVTRVEEALGHEQ
jgi:acyl carrier protein